MKETKFLVTKDGDISDGHHTFGELYDHRCLLFIRLCLAYKSLAAWKWDDSTPGWFLLYLELPEGQISYHIRYKYFGMVRDYITHDQNHKWDGHTSDDVLKRLSGQDLD